MPSCNNLAEAGSIASVRETDKARTVIVNFDLPWEDHVPNGTHQAKKCVYDVGEQYPPFREGGISTILVKNISPRTDWTIKDAVRWCEEKGREWIPDPRTLFGIGANLSKDDAIRKFPIVIKIVCLETCLYQGELSVLHLQFENSLCDITLIPADTVFDEKTWFSAKPKRR